VVESRLAFDTNSAAFEENLFFLRECLIKARREGGECLGRDELPDLFEREDLVAAVESEEDPKVGPEDR
jgi:hypothetical protein